MVSSLPFLGSILFLIEHHTWIVLAADVQVLPIALLDARVALTDCGCCTSSSKCDDLSHSLADGRAAKIYHLSKCLPFICDRPQTNFRKPEKSTWPFRPALSEDEVSLTAVATRRFGDSVRAISGFDELRHVRCVDRC